MQGIPGWKLSCLLLGATTFVTCLSGGVAAANDGNWTNIHDAGRCAIRGQCGKKSLFGGELPCPDNGLAEEPEKETREKLVDICGTQWEDGDVCCNGDQVSAHSLPSPKAVEVHV